MQPRSFNVLDSSAGKYIRTRPVNIQPGSKESFGIARNWLSDCLHGQDHASCRRASSSFMPTRLIEIVQRPVDSEIEGEWRIRLSYPDQTAPYAALSYCWGGDQPLKATRDSEHGWLQDINWEQVPQTLRDAVITSSELNIRFLWIDSLCILQDDDHDKAHEISQMPQIYGHSTVTIAAARSDTARQGFLHDRDLETDITKFPNLIFEVPFRCPTGDLASVTLLRPFDRREPTITRAWTLQEGLLASRVLEIGTRNTSWYCQETWDLKGNYTDGWKVRPQFRDGGTYCLDHDHEVFQAPFKNQSNWQYQARAVGTRSALELWLKTVHAYTSRALTFPSDKLLAISAIAEKYGTVFNDDYLAGLWRFSLPISLVWSVNPLNGLLLPRPKEYRAPSWSWAAVEGPVYLDLRKKAYQGVMEVEPRDVLSQVIACEVKLSNKGFQYGTISSGTLTMKGFVRDALWSKDNNLLVKRSRTPKEEGSEGYCAENWLEWKADAADDAVDAFNTGKAKTVSVLLLSVIGEDRGSRNQVGLVLRKLDDSRFRRVGMFSTGQTKIRGQPRFDDDAWSLFADCQEEVVTII